MGGAEGGADMFQVKYFDQRAYLNQSPQQYKQTMVGVLKKCLPSDRYFGVKIPIRRGILRNFRGWIWKWDLLKASKI